MTLVLWSGCLFLHFLGKFSYDNSKFLAVSVILFNELKLIN